MPFADSLSITLNSEPSYFLWHQKWTRESNILLKVTLFIACSLLLPTMWVYESFKVILIGDNWVGKSSFIRRYSSYIWYTEKLVLLCSPLYITIQSFMHRMGCHAISHPKPHLHRHPECRELMETTAATTVDMISLLPICWFTFHYFKLWTILFPVTSHSELGRVHT